MSTPPISPGDDAQEPELVEAVRDLSGKVTELTDHLSVSQDQANRTERQAVRTKYLTRMVLVLVLISLFGVFVMGILVQKVGSAVDGNKVNAVVNCQNANESRRASKALWDFIINASLSADQNPETVKLLSQLQEYVAAIYEPRDCSDLGRKYPLPDPPALPRPTS